MFLYDRCVPDAQNPALRMKCLGLSGLSICVTGKLFCLAILSRRRMTVSSLRNGARTAHILAALLQSLSWENLNQRLNWSLDKELVKDSGTLTYNLPLIKKTRSLVCSIYLVYKANPQTWPSSSSNWVFNQFTAFLNSKWLSLPSQCVLCVAY